MRPALASFFLFGLGLASRGEAPPAAAAPPSETAKSPPGPPASPPRTRRHTVSPELAAKLREALPKYAPPQPGSTPPTPAPGDVPQNDILRLPRYNVRAQKIPDFREREMLTPKGRIDVVLKRHPGLNFGPFKFLNLRRGLEMLAEEQAAERAHEMGELMGFLGEVETIRQQEKKQSPPAKK
jgi:hypothetical protein